MGRERHAAFTCETQCFAHFGISCELGNRKKSGRETDRRNLLMKRQCFAQFGKRSAACRAMFSQQNRYSYIIYIFICIYIYTYLYM